MEQKAEKNKENTQKTKEEEKDNQKKPQKKKTEAIAKGFNLPISTKKSASICRFIKNKEITKAIEELEEVIKEKKAVPMKGEVPHRKGKIMSGRFPKKTSKYFVKLLKNLLANCTVNEIENPVICTAISNIGTRPYARFGKYRRKRTNVIIIARERKINVKEKK